MTALPTFELKWNRSSKGWQIVYKLAGGEDEVLATLKDENPDGSRPEAAYRWFDEFISNLKERS